MKKRNNESFFRKKEQDDVNVIHKLANGLSEEKLLLASKLFKSITEGIMITDTTGVIRFINPSFSKITGYGKEVIGLNPRILKSGKHDKSFYNDIWNSVEGEGQWQGEIWNKRKNGEVFIQSTTITVIKDDDGNPLFFASVFTDITQRKKEEEQLGDDLLMAREIQKGLLSKPIHNDHIHIEGVYLPSIMLGGDMYVWYKIDTNRYGVFLMDVMGHGVASSLVCMSLRPLLGRMIKRLVHPESVMKELNKEVISMYAYNEYTTLKKYYVTGIYVVIDTKEKTIQYASAGHPPGFLIDEIGNATELGEGCIPLGMLPEIDVETGSLHYTGEAKLVLYTDGVFDDEQYTTSENIGNLKALVIENQKVEAKDLLHKIITKSSNKAGSVEFHDDVTIIAATIY
jgi:phosphoserine phosphatase RsbU/P